MKPTQPSSSPRIFSLAVFFFIACSCLSSIHADPPKDPSFQDYSAIIQKNPFAKFPAKEVKTVKINDAAPPPPAEKYVLKGVSKMPDGWFVVMANVKTPREDLMVQQGQKNKQDIEIVGVQQDKLDYTKTEVTIKVNNLVQVISYTPSLFTKTNTAALNKANANNQNNALPQNRNNSNQSKKNPNTSRNIPPIKRR